MIILVDCDGVLADFIGTLCTELAPRGIKKSPNEIHHWDLTESLDPEEMKVATQVMTAPGFCASLDWYEGAIELVKGLSLIGEVHAVTAPLKGNPTWMHERLGWLSSEVQSDRIHFVSGKYKHLVRGDVLIEDHPGNAYAWLEANPQGTAILIDRPWNSDKAREYRWHERMLRASSFDGVISTVMECSR